MPLEPGELSAAQAVKLVKYLIDRAEKDSSGNPWQALKDTVAKLDPISDAILANQTMLRLDDSAYLIGQVTC